MKTLEETVYGVMTGTLEEARQVGDTITYEKGGKSKTAKIVKVDKKNGQTRYELSNAGFVYDSDLTEAKKKDSDKDKDKEGTLDPVKKDQLKKDDVEDREDDDLDNDGDTDDSDEYLHKRRKAISGSIKKATVDD